MQTPRVLGGSTHSIDVFTQLRVLPLRIQVLFDADVQVRLQDVLALLDRGGQLAHVFGFGLAWTWAETCACLGFSDSCCTDSGSGTH